LEVPNSVKLTVRYCNTGYGGRANVVSLSNETELFADRELFLAQSGGITHTGPGWGPLAAREGERPTNIQITSGTGAGTRTANLTLNMARISGTECAFAATADVYVG
jgi:hypothetical protein